MTVDLNKPRTIKMDAASMKLVNPQLATIKRQTLYSALLLGCFVPIVFAWILIMLIGILGSRHVSIDLDQIIALIIALALLVGVFYVVRRSMRLPNYTFDGTTRSLKISGRDARTVPFDAFKSFTIVNKAGYVVEICLTLKDGQAIPLGSMSGSPALVEKNAAGMIEVLSALTGAAFTPPAAPDGMAAG